MSLFWAPGDAEALRSFHELGIARGILPVPPLGRDEVLAMLDRHAPLVDQVRA